jgi:site-specific DNA recombinase
MIKREAELPIYDASEQGVDQDIREASPYTGERNARFARYRGNRQALTKQLNNARSIDGVFSPPKPSDDTNYAAIYLRVSSEEQAKKGGTAEGYSIPFQRDACRAKAEAMGLVVIEEYVDAGQSAKSARRPRLQAMLRDLASKRVKYVIVHKIDRLARNKRDDFLINEAIAEAGASLVSVVDLVDDTPQGKFNYTIQAGLAQLYVDNLAVEVMKGLSKKVDSGGTPYRVPIGYVNKRRYEGVADIRWVEIDPTRGPLMAWAFDEYSTGDWSVAQLRDALTDKGLTTRPTPKQPAKQVSISTLHRALASPYYAGVVPWQGVYYEGAHDALVSMDTWLQVQDILRAHNAAGEKDRTHSIYLKGTVWCGSCGSRLVFSRNKGRGGTYDYLFCMGRRFKRTNCQRKAVRVSTVEAGVEAFYETFEVGQARTTAIREAVHVELASRREQAAFDSAQAKRRLDAARDERGKLLQAHYAGAVPQDLLKTEMDRLTREISAAEVQLKSATSAVSDLEQQLDRALAVAGNCARSYAEATPAVRRMLNQGFFSKLYIGEDGGVERVDLTEPFGSLLGESTGVDTPCEDDCQPSGETDEPATTGSSLADRQGGTDLRLTVTLTCGVTTRGQTNTQVRPRSYLGVKEQLLAEAEGFEPPDGLPSPASSCTRLSAVLAWSLPGQGTRSGERRLPKRVHWC